MDQKNVAYLKEALMALGFGDRLYASLEKNIQQRFPLFVLTLGTEINNQPFKATLFFEKLKGMDVYFFHRWDGKLMGNGGKKEQTFYIKGAQGVTLKEGFNLLEGRAVFREWTMDIFGQIFHAWIQLDFKNRDNKGNYSIRSFHKDYGFDLERALSKFPVKELMSVQKKEMLLRCLHKGDQRAVTLQDAAGTVKAFIEVSLQNKSIKFFNVNGKEIKVSEGRHDHNLLNGKHFKEQINSKNGLLKEVKNRWAKGASNKQREVA